MIGLTSALLVASLVNAEMPTYSVAVTRRVGLDAATALDLAEMFSLALERQPTFNGKRVSARAFAASLGAANTDPASCAGAIDCAAVLGRVGNVDWIFSVQLAKVGPSVVFDAALVRVTDGASLVTANQSVNFKQPVPDLDALAADIAARAPTLDVPSTAPQSQPIAATLPAPAASVPAATRAPTMFALSPGRYAAIGLGALAIGAVGGGVLLGVSALNQSDALRSTAASYDADRDAVLWTARGADIAYLSGIVLATAAAVMWAVLGPVATASAGAAQ